MGCLLCIGVTFIYLRDWTLKYQSAKRLKRLLPELEFAVKIMLGELDGKSFTAGEYARKKEVELRLADEGIALPDNFSEALLLMSTISVGHIEVAKKSFPLLGPDRAWLFHSREEDARKNELRNTPPMTH